MPPIGDRVRCVQCGTINPAGNRFCHGCGQPMQVICATCNQGNPTLVAFCGGCGVRLPASQPPSRALSRRAAHVEGELKQVTVLFADLVSSTELVASLDAEAAMWRLRPALDAMCLAVERSSGTVVRTLGDGILALFGAPHSLERHALLACQAALAIRDALTGDKAAPGVRIGLHSGEAVIDAPYADPAIEPGAYGVTLHLASRLPASVAAGGICLSSETYRLVRDACDVVSLGCQPLRGIPGQVELFQLIGLKPAVASHQFRGGDLTGFRGRDAEMGVLQRALLAAERGCGQIIGVVGVPGTGKSRLCFEFAEWCRSRKIPVAEARAQPYGAATPWQPVIEFLRAAWFGIAPEDDFASARRSIARRLCALGANLETDLPLVADFLGARQGDGMAAWLDPGMRITRLLAIFRLMLRQNGAATSVILFEDLHWLDDASEEFLTALAETIGETRIVLLVNYRPAYVSTWMRLSQFRQIELVELSAGDIEPLVRELIGPRRELAAIRRVVAERSGGNPYFAEELIRSLVDQAVLAGPPGDYHRGPAVATQTLPATLQAVIGSRIDLLMPAERELLQTAAIIGKEFPVSILRPLMQRRTEAALQTSLEHLCRTGMFQPRTMFGSVSYGFRHPLIHEVAYSSQLRVVRGRQHAAVAEVMERIHCDRLDENGALLSYHLEEAGEIERAAHYAARAARWSGSTSPAQAIRHWHKVRLLLARLPRSVESDTLRIMASTQIVWLGWREGLTAEQARPFIQEGLIWAQECDPSMGPLLLFVEGRIAGASGGQADEYVAVVRRALALMQASHAAGRRAILSASLCQAYGWAGLIREALAANDVALARVPDVTEQDNQFLGYGVEHWALSLRGRILIRLGRLEEAQACFERVLAVEGLSDPVVQQMTYLPHFELAWCLDDAAMAARHARQVAASAAYQDSPYLQVYAAACSGISAALDRDYPAALQRFGEGLRRLRQARVAMEYEPELLAYLAEVSLRQGDHAAAMAAGREAMAIAMERNTRLPDCRARMTVASVLLIAGGGERGQRQQAEALLAGAAELIRVSGIRIYDRLLVKARGLGRLQIDGRLVPADQEAELT